jgi:phage/plasmid-associated DNA primase
MIASELVTGAATASESEEAGGTKAESAGEPAPAAREDALSRFVEEQCERKPGEWTPTGEVHEEYAYFCETNGEQPLSAAHFSRELGERYGLAQERRKVQGVVTRGIQGIRLKRT